MALSNQSKYDVFLSFRGEDTRKSFVEPLYAALTRNGIITFPVDDKEKSTASLKEIEDSRYAIVVFSKSYASSSWCLDELVKIMECSKNNGQHVLPVFYYDFEPSNLRRHGLVFAELFAKHKMEKVKAWTSVLVEAANLNGLGLIDNSYEATHIKEIVDTVLSNLHINKLDDNENAMGKKHDNQNAMGKKHGLLEDTTSSHEKPIGIERRMLQLKEWLQVTTARKPDVFTCYESNDTCKDFADQLHSALKQRNICASRNDQELARLESSISERLKVMEESSIAVVILSKDFATSAWCLDELVKIMNRNERIGQSVFPVYYDVDPSDVRNQKGLFGEAFMKNMPGKVEIWRKALVKVCSLAGWYLNCTPKSDKAKVIGSIVDAIARRLEWLSLSIDDNLIGIETRMKHVMSLLKLESGGVETIAIWGMGGIGKTTIARAVFDQVSTCFDGSCFVENIREVSKSHGLEHIKREMFSTLSEDEKLHVTSNYEGIDPTRDWLVHHKVLIVLDDVDDKSQLDMLVGSNKWLAEGSRIIITTRDETLLAAHNIMHSYYVKPLDDNESFHFLRRHAFKKDESTKEYLDLLPQVVRYADGLPLALKVLSSLLYGRSKKEWTSTLDRLQVFPEKVIQDTLKISYDGLDSAEKELFLHIACFFNDTEKDYAVNILDSCGFPGEAGIRILEQKSLMRILKGNIRMHKLIQQMGKDIARQMHPDEPAKRSRLWLAEEVYDTLLNSKSMEEVDAIVVDNLYNYDYEHDYDVEDFTKAFRSMKKLRLLQIHSHNKLRFLEGSNYLPKRLRWLTLENYPLPSLPTSFKGNELVGLELLGSSISEPWSGIKFMWSLRFLDLSHSRNLIKTPNFTGTPNLKEIKLEYCIRLIEVHESIGYLDRLRLLSFKSCRKLENLPQSFWKLKSLTSLDLSGCLNLKHPYTLLDNGLEFHANGPMIKVPGSIEILSNLVELDLSNFRSLSIPSLHGLKFGEGRFTLHDLLKDKLSLRKTPQELVEDKKENIALLPGKGV